MNMYQVDEASINANAALANTNNPDDQVKIENLYNSFKKGKISRSEFDRGINYYIQPSPKFDDKVNEKIANDITEGSKVWGDPEKLALRAAAARQGLRADRQHRLNENYYTDAYGSKLFHDAMDGNIVTPDSIRAAEYVRQLRAANAAKAQAAAEKKAEDVAKAKAAAGKNNKPGKNPRMSDDEIDAFLKEELGGNTTGGTYASPGVPKGGVVSPATMMRTSGVQPVQASYGNNAPMGEGFDYTITYDPMSNSMKPNDPYSYYDPSRNVPSGGDGTDLTLTYDPMTGQMVRR